MLEELPSLKSSWDFSGKIEKKEPLYPPPNPPRHHSVVIYWTIPDVLIETSRRTMSVRTERTDKGAPY